MRGTIKTPSDRGEQAADRNIADLIASVVRNRLGVTERTVTRMQELTGERGESAMPLRAVRRQDMVALAKVPELRSKAVSAAPTAAEFNALRSDIVALFEAISTVAKAIS